MAYTRGTGPAGDDSGTSALPVQRARHSPTVPPQRTYSQESVSGEEHPQVIEHRSAQDRWTEAREALGVGAPTLLLGTSSWAMNRWARRLSAVGPDQDAKPAARRYSRAGTYLFHRRSVISLSLVIVVAAAVTAWSFLANATIFGYASLLLVLMAGLATTASVVFPSEAATERRPHTYVEGRIDVGSSQPEQTATDTIEEPAIGTASTERTSDNQQ